MIHQHHKADIIDGKLVLKDKQRFTNGMFNMPDGAYLITVEKFPDTSLRGWMNRYRLYVDVVAKDAGESRNDLHNMVKKDILPELFQNPELLLQPIYPEISTKYLNEQGWDMLLKNFSIWVLSRYDYCI